MQGNTAESGRISMNFLRSGFFWRNILFPRNFQIHVDYSTSWLPLLPTRNIQLFPLIRSISVFLVPSTFRSSFIPITLLHIECRSMTIGKIIRQKHNVRWCHSAHDRVIRLTSRKISITWTGKSTNTIKRTSNAKQAQTSTETRRITVEK